MIMLSVIALFVVSFIALSIIAVSLYLALRVSFPPRIVEARVLADEAEKGYIDLARWNSLRKKDFVFDSPYGYTLRGVRVYSDTPATDPEGKPLQRVLVLCHGHGFSLVGSIKYLDHFLDLGFDAVMYDHRACGRSGGRGVSMGYFEKDDLSTLLDILRSEYGSDVLVGTLGESMGGATVILQAAGDSPPSFVIADCPYSDLRAELAYRLKVENHLPSFPFVGLASIFTRIKSGYYYSQVSPLSSIREKGGLPLVPVLFMHGGSDDYIPSSMSQTMHEAKEGVKGFCVVPDARHGNSVATDCDLYMRTVDEFLSRI